MYKRRSVAFCVGIILCVWGVIIAVRGECRARRLANLRRSILESHHIRIARLEQKIGDSTLSEAERNGLQGELAKLKEASGLTGVPRYLQRNAKLLGYGWGASLEAMGIACIVFAMGARRDANASV